MKNAGSQMVPLAGLEHNRLDIYVTQQVKPVGYGFGRERLIAAGWVRICQKGPI